MRDGPMEWAAEATANGERIKAAMEKAEARPRNFTKDDLNRLGDLLAEVDDLLADLCGHGGECECERCEPVHVWRAHYDACPDYWNDPKYQDCVTCERRGRGAMEPDHDGSSRCESGSIASGGTNAHCTCDVCF
jgi:hypothetical protein